MTTPLFLLRCTELGLGMLDLDYLTIGLVTDMLVEKSNDDYEYEEEEVIREATQEDFDRW